MAVAEHAVGRIGPPVISCHSLIRDRIRAVRQAGEHAEVASRVREMSLGVVDGQKERGRYYPSGEPRGAAEWEFRT
jgi:hypothetical protein